MDNMRGMTNQIRPVIENRTRILSFTTETYSQYKSIENTNIHRFKGKLPKYCIQKYETLYVLMYKPRFLSEQMIGRCIVANTTQIKDKETLDFISRLHHISKEILLEYPTIIEDMYILPSKRGMGYGKFFTEYVLVDIKKFKVSLKAQDDGMWFWPKQGFKEVGNEVFIK